MLSLPSDLRRTEPEPCPPEVRVVRGRERVLALASTLAELAVRCGQRGATADLTYFLGKPGVLRRTPVLLLFAPQGEILSARPAAAELAGAALVYEYRIFGISTGVYTTNDRSGRSTLLAPEGSRGQLAIAVGQHLLRSGAHAVLLSFRSETDLPKEAVRRLGAAGMRFCWAARERTIPDYLALRPTYDETLASIGQRTRSNLRYSRRRAEKDLGCVFVPEAKISAEELLALNRQCMYAVADRVALWRFRALGEMGEPLLMGVQNREGRWLSLVGGRRVGAHSEILWQMNRRGHPAYSLSLVMRGYLIEHEIERGATRFYVEGGSPHPIRHSFIPGKIWDLALLRQSVPGRFVQKLARRLVEEENDLAQILFDPQVTWHASRPTRQAREAERGPGALGETAILKRSRYPRIGSAENPSALG